MSGAGINHASFLLEASRAQGASQAEQKNAAPHFSPFDSFIELSENKISDIVAWMLTFEASKLPVTSRSPVRVSLPDALR